MGAEAECTAHVGGTTAKGKALLETDELIFRSSPGASPFRVALALRSIKVARAEGGALILEHEGGEVRLELGPLAARWAERIANPRSRADKLGLKPGLRVALVAVDDAEFVSEVRRCCGHATVGRAPAHSEVIFLGVRSRASLAKIATLKDALDPRGCLWTIRPRGQDDVSEARVSAAAHEAGLVDVKVVRFSETHTAEKFVIPRTQRGASVPERPASKKTASKAATKPARKKPGAHPVRPTSRAPKRPS